MRNGVLGAKEAGSEGPAPITFQARAEIGRIVWMHDDIVELRGLFVDVEKRLARFDAVAGFGCKEVSDLRGELVSECESALPGWTIEARILADI